MLSSTGFVLVLLTLIFGFVIVLRWQSLRSKRNHHERSSEEIDRVDRELAELRERVKTLERIVTDDRYRLEREFDNLETPARRSG